jgi:hypothetical protein
MHRKLRAACVPLCAFAALIILPAVASGSPVMTTSKGAIAPVGTKYKGTTIGPTRMTAGGGVVLECSAGVNSGVLTKNTGTQIEGEIETLEVSGTGPGGDCTSSLGNFKVTTNVGNGVPYCMSATKGSDTLSIRGGSCSSAARPITYLVDMTSLGISCGYERTTAITASFTTSPSDATATQSEVEFKSEAGNSFFCPTGVKLDAAMTLEEVATSEPAFVS